MALVSLCKCADSPEPWLLPYTKYGSRGRLGPKFRPLALLDASTWAFFEDLCAYAVSTKILCGGPLVFKLVINRSGLYVMT